MRRFAFPLLFVVAACTGGGALDGTTSPSGSSPTGKGTAPRAADWSDAIVGDGMIAGTADPTNGAKDSMAPAGAVTSSSGTSLPSSPSGAGGSSSGSGSSAGTSSGGSSGSSGASTGSGEGETSGGYAGASSSGGYAPPPVTTPIDNGYESMLTAGAWDDNKNFPFFSTYRTGILGSPNDGYLGITADETLGAMNTFGAAQPQKTKLDISLMIDTTGSMDDEIAYLQNELITISQAIEKSYPQAEQHWSLVLYKDKHDEYVVKWFDFRADASQVQAKLMTASAGGGGDFPESPEQALGVAHRLSWRRDPSVARLLFWVADAPHHNEDTPAMTAAVKAARDKNIHIYPVAASGVDAFTEYTMRSTAQLTGGRYLFLTDDSGIGDAHEVPILPCYFVTKLDKAILRMVDVELTGTYREPGTDEILRTGGDPKNGACIADNGVTVQIY